MWHRRRQKTEPSASVSNGATGTPIHSKIKRRIVLRPVLVIILGVLFWWRNDIAWFWRNRYLYVGCPEYKLWLNKPEVKSRYVTAKFGATPDSFKDDVQTHSAKIVDSGVYQKSDMVSLTSFPSYILNDRRWDKHLTFTKSPAHASRRGAGYWFWKPVILLHELNQMKEGEFLLYTDADREDFVSWTALLLETMVSRNADLAMEQMSYLEKKWTKADMYNAMQCGLAEHDTSMQYSGNFILMRKNQATLMFLQKWIELALDYHLISDERSVESNAKGFVENRHDQSLMSMLLKCSFDEPKKEAFEYTCLGDWTLYTFKLLKE